MTRTRPIGRISDDYLELVKGFPLRPIRNEEEREAAILILRKLAVRPSAALSTGEMDYLEALTRFVEDYEQSRHRIKLAHLKPLDLLKHLMKESGMKPADLAHVLGSQPASSLILAGKRQLSKAHIRKLAAHFHVDASLFL